MGLNKKWNLSQKIKHPKDGLFSHILFGEKSEFAKQTLMPGLQSSKPRKTCSIAMAAVRRKGLSLSLRTVDLRLDLRVFYRWAEPDLR
jgi:hypothetical protein